MALGWGLWEGPARFYFWPYKLLPEDLQTDNPLKPKKLFEVDRRSVAVIGIPI